MAITDMSRTEYSALIPRIEQSLKKVVENRAVSLARATRQECAARLTRLQVQLECLEARQKVLEEQIGGG